MAPRQEGLSLPANTLLPCLPSSWPMLALCSAASAFIGLVFFIVGLIGVISRSEVSKVRDWIFLSFGIAMLTIGLSLLLLCRVRTSAAHSPRTRRRAHRAVTHPIGRHDPLPVWSIDAIDESYRPPPEYHEAIHCSSSPLSTQSMLMCTRPPPYAPPSGRTRQSRSTFV